MWRRITNGMELYVGVGNLVFIDKLMDKWIYLNVLKNNIKQNAKNMGILNNFKFYADNGPKHNSYVVRSWLLYNCPKVLETPPRSPDINIIEHLWDELERKIRLHNITSKETLRRALQEEWSKIMPEFCENLVKSIPRRLQCIKNARG